jgi:hypothetical protein
MLDIKPETMESIKARFYKAFETPSDTHKVLSGEQKPVSKLRSNVFDFDDGMRLVASVDLINDEHFLHLSVSGTDAYYKTLKGEGLNGLVEDVLLRMAALTGMEPPSDMQAMVNKAGIFHLIFGVDPKELFEKCKEISNAD